MTIARSLLLLLLALASIGTVAHEYHLGALDIRHPWSRPTAEGMMVGVAYFEIVNRGKVPDTLLSASSAVCESVEFHRTILEDGMARMRPAGELVIAAGATLKAEPEGLHLMLMGLKQPLVAGTEVPLKLRFKDAGEITVQLKIGHPGQAAPAHAH